MKINQRSFSEICITLLTALADKSEEVDVGTWHAQDVSGVDALISKELRHVNFQWQVPTGFSALQVQVQPNLPWAEDHFEERVSGYPLNPPPSEKYWPFAQQSNQVHKSGEIFAHTYPERYWPRFADRYARAEWIKLNQQQMFRRMGIRFQYGDLQDVVNLLIKQPNTRQAYLPVWFPEDTGALNSQRVPCSIGYHFLFRNTQLDCTYFIRSCDFMRHFIDDVYLTCRLMQWVMAKMNAAGIGVEKLNLVMQIASLHVFKGDTVRINKLLNDYEDGEPWRGI